MKTYKKWILVGCSLLVSAGVLQAQALLPRLGEQRVGTAAMTFLKIDMGARAAAMAGAFVPVANDATTLFWNPAGLVQVNDNEAVVSHIQWPVDIQYEFAGYVHQLGHTFAVGFSTGFLYTEDMEVTTEFHPNGTGEFFGYHDFFAGGSFSVRMTDRFSFGATVKFVQEKLAELEMNGVMLDLGTFYWTGFRSLRLAASLRNFGSTVRPSGTYWKRTTTGGFVEANYTNFSPPTSFSLGAAMEVLESPKHKTTVSMQMNHPLDNAETAVVGVEYSFAQQLILRGGYRFGFEEGRWTLGAGANVTIGGMQLMVDYAYVDFGQLNMAQHFSLHFKF